MRGASLTQAALVLLAACGPAPAQAPSLLQGDLERAADLEGVPRAILVSLAWVDARFSMRGGAPSADQGYGLCHLIDRADAPAGLSLARAAALTGLPPDAIRSASFSSARGCAALLRAEADLLFARYPALREDRLGDWYAAVMRLSGSTAPLVADSFAAQLYRAMRDGIRGFDDQGAPVLLAPQMFDLAGRNLAGTIEIDSAGEYCPSGTCVAFVPASSSNFAAGRNGVAIDTLVIHDMEGTYSSTIAWFQNPASQVSAHYDVRSSDGAITQQVLDADTAWHAGNRAINQSAIGIEHEGYAAQGTQWYTEAMYQSSAALARWLCDSYSIPKDRQHIIGHDEVPDPNHPGWFGGASHHHDPCDVWAGNPTAGNVVACDWDWNHYLALIRGGGGTTALTTAVTAPASGAIVTGAVTVSATTSSATARVELYVDGALLSSGPSPLTARWNAGRASNGAHALQSKATDGSAAAASSVVTVTVANPAPSVSITAPAAGSTLSGAVTIQVSGSATATALTLQLDGATVASGGNPLSFAWDTAAAANGSHRLVATATDLAGNAATSAPVAVTVSNAAPPPPPAPCPSGTTDVNGTCVPNQGCGSANGGAAAMAGLLALLARRGGRSRAGRPKI